MKVIVVKSIILKTTDCAVVKIPTDYLAPSIQISTKIPNYEWFVLFVPFNWSTSFERNSFEWDFLAGINQKVQIWVRSAWSYHEWWLHTPNASHQWWTKVTATKREDACFINARFVGLISDMGYHATVPWSRWEISIYTHISVLRRKPAWRKSFIHHSVSACRSGLRCVDGQCARKYVLSSARQIQSRWLAMATQRVLVIFLAWNWRLRFAGDDRLCLGAIRKI